MKKPIILTPEQIAQIKDGYAVYGKLNKESLKNLVKGSYRVIDVTTCDKQSLVYLLMQVKFGNRMLEAYYDLKIK